MESLSKILQSKKANAPDRRNAHEFQAYGNRLADEFNDSAHRSLYIKLARETDRNLLEAAREFIMRNEKATTKGKLFMWKLAQLKKSKIDTN